MGLYEGKNAFIATDQNKPTVIERSGCGFG